LKTTKGQKFSTEVPLSKGEPENPASDEDFVRKYQQNVVSQDKSLSDQILDMTLTLETQQVSPLATLLGKLQGN
jgi:2-methylcitrate dehydratase PrpD